MSAIFSFVNAVRINPQHDVEIDKTNVDQYLTESRWLHVVAGVITIANAYFLCGSIISCSILDATLRGMITLACIRATDFTFEVERELILFENSTHKDPRPSSPSSSEWEEVSEDQKRTEDPSVEQSDAALAARSRRESFRHILSRSFEKALPSGLVRSGVLKTGAWLAGRIQQLASSV